MSERSAQIIWHDGGYTVTFVRYYDTYAQGIICVSGCRDIPTEDIRKWLIAGIEPIQPEPETFKAAD